MTLLGMGLVGAAGSSGESFAGRALEWMSEGSGASADRHHSRYVPFRAWLRSRQAWERSALAPRGFTRTGSTVYSLHTQEQFLYRAEGAPE